MKLATLSRIKGPTTRSRRGAASLIVVLVLFFLMSLVAAYTSRNLIFEQRTSVNQYRAMQAFEAAEAGLEWALAQLNGGRIGPDCTEASADATSTSFRQRYLQVNSVSTSPTAGMVTALLQPDGVTALRPTCVWTGATWQCVCPTNAAPTLNPPSGDAIHPAFRVKFTTYSVTSPGTVRIDVTGCTRLTAACLDSGPQTTDQEGRAQVRMLVALKPSIPTVPLAAVTARGAVNIEGLLSAAGGDEGARALRFGVGAAVTGAGTLTLLPAGTPSAALVAPNDTTLRPPAVPLPSPGADAIAIRNFGMVLGATPATYKAQPGAIVVECPGAECSAATLAAKVAANPDRVIWIEGDLTLEAAATVGSVANPATFIVTGDVDLVAGAQIVGFVYARGSNFSGGGSVRGAVFFEGDLNVPLGASPSVSYDGSVLDLQWLRAGSYVRVPGSWRDFAHSAASP
jgi:Tfp pilus assembly protein PilX